MTRQRRLLISGALALMTWAGCVVGGLEEGEGAEGWPDEAVSQAPVTLPSIPVPGLLATQNAGSVAGRGVVSPSGVYTYEIPIQVAPGREGIQPSVSLVYSSGNTANGTMGVGWSVTGGSSITRCAKTKASGNFRDSINFVNSDGYCLDGQVLVLVSGTYGTANSEYRTETETFQKVVLTTVASPVGPTAWTVFRKDGTIATYLSTLAVLNREVLRPDGGVETTTPVNIEWPVDNVTDRKGNRISYSYTPSTVSGSAAGQLNLPLRIEYTRCVASSSCGYPNSRLRGVDFTYETRAVADQRTSYVSGVKVVMERRLATVATSIMDSNGQPRPVLKYQLKYVQSGTTGKTLLKSVQQCDALDVCLPKTDFNWQGESAPTYTIRGSGGGSIQNNLLVGFTNASGQAIPGNPIPENSILLYDANGDGNDDILLKEWLTDNAGIRTSSSPSGPEDYVLFGDGLGYFNSTRRMVDADNDGLTARSTPTTEAEVVEPSFSQPVDLDGDGVKELVVAFNSSGLILGGKRMSGPTFNPNSGASSTTRYGVLSWNGTKLVQRPISGIDFLSWETSKVRFMDVNSDGLPDRFSGSNDNIFFGTWTFSLGVKTAVSPADAPQVDYSTTTFDTLLTSFPVPDVGCPRPPLDLVTDEDGNGRPEFLQRSYDAKQRSYSWNANNSQALFRIRDVLGNGLSETFTNTASPSVTWGQPNLSVSTMRPWRFVDVNGDGLKDALYSTRESQAHPQVWFLRINTGAGYRAPQGVGAAASTLVGYSDQISGLSCPVVGSDVGIRVADMNGDGRDDLVLLEPLIPYGTFGGYATTTGAIRVLYSNGVDFNAPVTLPSHGLPRLISPQVTPPAAGQWAMAAVGDLDGNGLPDVVEMVAETGSAPLKRRLVTYSLGLPGGADLLTAVVDEVGTAAQVVYDSLSAGSSLRRTNSHNVAGDFEPFGSDTHEAAGAAACAYPAACTARGRVVTAYADNRSARDLNFEYKYRGARTDMLGRGGLGFESTTVYDLVTDVQTTYHFVLTPVVMLSPAEGSSRNYTFYPRAGNPSSTTVYPPGGDQSPLPDAVGGLTATTFIATPTFANTMPVRKTSETLSYQDYIFSNDTVQQSRVTDYVYDIFGSPTSITTTTEDFRPSPHTKDKAVSTVTYNNDAGSWMVGLPGRVVVASSTTADALGVGCPASDSTPCLSSTQTTDFQYDVAGYVTKVIQEPNDTGSLKLTVAMGRDDAGVLRTQTLTSADGGVRVSNIEYDSTGSLAQAFINPAGHVNFVLYDITKAWPYATVDVNGAKTVIKRDGVARVREVVSDNGSQHYVSYSKSLVRQSVDGGADSAAFFDVHGRPDLTTRSTFGGGAVVTGTTYDALGNVIGNQWDSSGSNHATVSATRAAATGVLTGGFTTYTASYDVLGRRVSTLHTGGATTAYTYVDPRTTNVVQDDPQAHHTKTVFVDAHGRTSRVTESTATGSTGGTSVVTDYGYTELGQPARVQNSGSIKNTFSYDRLGRKLAWDTTGMSSRGRWTYNGFGDVISAVDDARPLTLKVDALSRLTSRAQSDGGDSQLFTWDGDGGAGQRGNLTLAVFGGHRSVFGYDSLGRLSSRREIFDGGDSLSFGYTYDSAGRTRTIRYPETTGDVFSHPGTGGFTVTYAYRNGELESLAGPDGGKVWTVLSRHPLTAMTTAARDSANLTQRWAYNPESLFLESVGVDGGVTSGPRPFQSFIYNSLGDVGDRTTGDLTEHYDYDGLNRLTGYLRNQTDAGQLSVAATFGYTARGDFTAVTAGSAATSPDWPNLSETYTQASSGDVSLLSSLQVGSNTDTFGYSNGSLISVTRASTVRRTYTYNAFDLPSRIVVQNSSPNFTTDFAYDAFGARVRKTRDANNFVTYVGKLYEARKLLAQNVQESVFRLQTDEGIVGEVAKSWAGGTQTRIFHRDNQGSPVYQTVGTVSTYLGAFFPYGKRMAGATPAQTMSSLGYTGHTQDDDLGLVNMNGRIYDVAQRRFITRDAIVAAPGTQVGPNPYAYVLDNPTNLTDPSGFDPGGPRGWGPGGANTGSQTEAGDSSGDCSGCTGNAPGSGSSIDLARTAGQGNTAGTAAAQHNRDMASAQMAGSAPGGGTASAGMARSVAARGGYGTEGEPNWAAKVVSAIEGFNASKATPNVVDGSMLNVTLGLGLEMWAKAFKGFSNKEPEPAVRMGIFVPPLLLGARKYSSQPLALNHVEELLDAVGAANVSIDNSFGQVLLEQSPDVLQLFDVLVPSGRTELMIMSSSDQMNIVYGDLSNLSPAAMRELNLAFPASKYMFTGEPF